MNSLHCIQKEAKIFIYNQFSSQQRLIILGGYSGLLGTKLKLYDLSRCGSPVILAVHVIMMLQVISDKMTFIPKIAMEFLSAIPNTCARTDH